MGKSHNLGVMRTFVLTYVPKGVHFGEKSNT